MTAQMLLEHGLIVALALVVLAGAIGLGRLVLRHTRTPVQGSCEAIALAAAIGLATIGLGVFALAGCRQLTPMAIGVILAAAALAGLAGWRTPLALPPSAATSLPLIEKLAAALLVVVLGSCLAGALTPAVGTDELTYHLAAPKTYLRHGGFFFIEGNLFANYPLGAEMLYAVALVLKGDILAKVIHLAVGGLILVAMAAFWRHHLNGRGFVWLSLLIFASLPSVFVNARMAYNDLVFCLCCLLAVYTFANWTDRGQRHWLAWCAVFSGAAMSVKYAGLLLPLLAIVVIAHQGHRQNLTRAAVAGNTALYLGLVMLAGAPFYLKNAVLTGNPIYPFAHGIFGGPGWDETLARRYGVFLRELGMGRNWSDYLLLPWNLSVHARMNSPRFDGVIGPLFLLVLPLGLAARPLPSALKTALGFCLAYFVFWAFTAQQIRYLFPVFPFLALTVGFIVQQLRAKPVVQALALAAIAGSLVFNGVHLVRDLAALAPLDYLTGRQDRHAFIARHVPAYPLYRFANENLSDRDKLFLIYMRNLGFLCERPFYSDSILESHTLEQVLSQSADPDQVRLALAQKGFTHIMVDHHFVLGSSSPLSPAHQALFAAFERRHLALLAALQERYFLFALR